MANSYSIAESNAATAGDRLSNVNAALIPLQDGRPLFLGYDPSVAAPNQVKVYFADPTNRTVVTTVSTATAGASGGLQLGYPQSLCMVRVPYLTHGTPQNPFVVIGVDYTNPHKIQMRGWNELGNVPYSFVGSYNSTIALAPSGQTITGVAAVWCNDGGGDQGFGHILIVANTAAGNNYYAIVEAWDAIGGGASAWTDSGLNPTFLGSGNASVDGSNIDIAQDGFGATTGLAVAANSTTTATVGAWGVSSSGKLTVSTRFTYSLSTGTLSGSTKIRIAQVSSNLFVVAAPTPAATTIRCSFFSASQFYANATTPTTNNFPSPGATLSWDLMTGPTTSQQIFILGWHTTTPTTLLSVPITVTTPSAPVVGAVATIGTAIGSGTPTTLRAMKDPTDTLHSDFQAYTSTTPYPLVGGFTAIIGNPSVPTITAPTTGGVLQLAGGGTVTWTFNASSLGDTQTAYYLRRQLVGGNYQWWTGTAWTAGQSAPTGGQEVSVASSSQSVVFAAGFWTAATYYNLAVQVAGSTGLLSGYTADVNFEVSNPVPTTPTLSANYDTTTNRVVLVLTGTDATAPTGQIEYSDDGGTTWSLLRYGQSLTVYPSAATVYDIEATPATQRMYRGSVFTAAPVAQSAYANATGNVTTFNFWLGDPTSQGTWIALNVKPGTFQTQFHETQTYHEPLGRKLPVVISDQLMGEDGGCTLWTGSDADEAKLQTLLLSQRVLYLTSPENKGWYIRIVTDRPVVRPIPGTTNRYREHSITWRQTDKP